MNSGYLGIIVLNLYTLNLRWIIWNCPYSHLNATVTTFVIPVCNWPIGYISTENIIALHVVISKCKPPSGNNHIYQYNTIILGYNREESLGTRTRIHTILTEFFIHYATVYSCKHYAYRAYLTEIRVLLKYATEIVQLHFSVSKVPKFSFRGKKIFLHCTLERLSSKL